MQDNVKYFKRLLAELSSPPNAIQDEDNLVDAAIALMEYQAIIDEMPTPVDAIDECEVEEERQGSNGMRRTRYHDKKSGRSMTIVSDDDGKGPKPAA